MLNHSTVPGIEFLVNPEPPRWSTGRIVWVLHKTSRSHIAVVQVKNIRHFFKQADAILKLSKVDWTRSIDDIKDEIASKPDSKIWYAAKGVSALENPKYAKMTVDELIEEVKKTWKEHPTRW